MSGRLQNNTQQHRQRGRGSDMNKTRIREKEDSAPVSDTEKIKVPASLFSFTGVLCIISMIGILGMLLYFSESGEAFLSARDDSVGEVLMKRGDRLVRAGSDKEALAYYEKALAARFAGAQNKTHTFEAAGLILWKQGHFDRAKDYLSRSLQGYQPTEEPYEALIDILLKEGHAKEAASLLEDWRSVRDEAADPWQSDKVLLASGKVAAALGKDEEALRLFQQGAEQGGAPEFSACLALYYAKAGDREKAISCLKRYFLRGGEGEKFRALYDALLSDKPNPDSELLSLFTP